MKVWAALVIGAGQLVANTVAAALERRRLLQDSGAAAAV